MAFAKSLLDASNFDGSFEQYGAALNVRPNDAAAQAGRNQVILTKNYLAMEAAWDQDPERAIKLLEENMQLDAGFRETRNKLYALLIMKADRLIGAGERDTAFPTLMQALDVLPDAGEAQKRLASYTPTPQPTATPRPAVAPQQQQTAPQSKPANSGGGDSRSRRLQRRPQRAAADRADQDRAQGQVGAAVLAGSARRMRDEGLVARGEQFRVLVQTCAGRAHRGRGSLMGQWHGARRVVSRTGLAVMLAAVVAVDPRAASQALGQDVPQQVCGAQSSAAPMPIGQPGADGWVSDQEGLTGAGDVRRYRFNVKERGTAYVYVGDQWYDLNLGLYSMKTGVEVGCWSVQVKGTSVESERRKLGFVRPDERAIEVEDGDYLLTARPADTAVVDPSRKFTVRVAVGPRVCALSPANVPDPAYAGMTNKPENPDLFQVGVSLQPDPAELSQFSLMSFNAYMSPPFTDLFDFSWELDGKVVPEATEATFLKPYADLEKTPLGLHTVKLTVKGAREYQDPTDKQFNILPFGGETRSVVCQFRGPA